MTADCIFCRIIRKEIPSQAVAETDRILAFQDLHPQAPTHVLIVHKTHTPSLAESPDNGLLGELFGGVRDVAAQLGLSDYRTVVNTGAEAGQTVFHTHVHLLAGRPLSWPPG